MRNTIMQTYKELTAIRNQSTGQARELFFEYASKYRRVTMTLEGSTWVLRVSYKDVARELKTWEKTYGDKEICAAWTRTQVENRNIIIGSLTIIEATGTILINRIAGK